MRISDLSSVVCSSDLCILLALINTGARPSEIASLLPEHIHLSGPVPYISIEPVGRKLKNPQSKRVIPLVGVSLAAFKDHPGFPALSLQGRYQRHAERLPAGKRPHENGRPRSFFAAPCVRRQDGSGGICRPHRWEERRGGKEWVMKCRKRR